MVHDELKQSTPTGTGPVTTSIIRRVIPGRDEAYEAWLTGITADAVQFAGHMGVNIIRPGGDSRRYVSIFRFDSFEHSQAWENSAIRQQWLSRLDGIVEGEDEIRKSTGLEFWFSLPELPAAHPSPHKMALVLLIVVFFLVLLINHVLAPIAADWPSVVQVFLSVFCQVMLMTYLVMPRVTRLLKPWLFEKYRDQAYQHRESDGRPP